MAEGHAWRQRAARIAAAVVLGLAAAPLHAQDTRAGQIEAQQEQKSEDLGVEQPDRVERAVVSALRSPLLAGSGGMFPWFGSVFEGAGFSAGAGYLHRMPRASQVTFIGGVSFNGSTLLSASYVAPRLFTRVEPHASINWARANDVSFFGLGNDSLQSNRTGYDFDPVTIKGGVTYRATSWLSFLADYNHIGFSTEVEESSRFTPQVLQSLSDRNRLRFNGSEFGVTLDTRTSPAYSTRGTLLRASTSYYSEVHDEQFEFQQNEVEAAQLIPLVREQFVLAFRALGVFTKPDPGNSAPLVLLPYIGSGKTVRGFETRRFVDRDAIVLTGEYRWRPSRFLDMAVFLDGGQVAPSSDALAWDRMKTSWGIGARLHGPAFSVMRAEVAHSVEGWRLVFATGGPF